MAAQEAHEAIRPTNINIEQIPDDMDNKEKKIYKLIWSIFFNIYKKIEQCKQWRCKINF